jgi:hypothetical protein
MRGILLFLLDKLQSKGKMKEIIHVFSINPKGVWRFGEGEVRELFSIQ